MSPEKVTLQRVQSALYHVRRGLAPFVEERMMARYGAQWPSYAIRALSVDPRATLDEYGLLKTMINRWRDAFEDAFPRADKHQSAASSRLRWRRATPARMPSWRSKMPRHSAISTPATNCCAQPRRPRLKLLKSRASMRRSATPGCRPPRRGPEWWRRRPLRHGHCQGRTARLPSGCSIMSGCILASTTMSFLGISTSTRVRPSIRRRGVWQTRAS